MPCLPATSLVADEAELSPLNAVPGSHSPADRWATENTPRDGEGRTSAHAIIVQARADSLDVNCCSVNARRGSGRSLPATSVAGLPVATEPKPTAAGRLVAHSRGLKVDQSHQRLRSAVTAGNRLLAPWLLVTPLKPRVHAPPPPYAGDTLAVARRPTAAALACRKRSPSRTRSSPLGARSRHTGVAGRMSSDTSTKLSIAA